MNKRKVGIINLNINNIFSIFNACQKAGFETKVISEKNNYNNFDLIILPGVGSFKEAMRIIVQKKIDLKLKKYIKNKNKKLLGICLGMQLLFESSNEISFSKGLGFLKGKVKKLDISECKIIPHMNWNNIFFQILKIKNKYKNFHKKFFYFVHSYYCDVYLKSNIFTLTRFNKSIFCSSVKFENIIGLQFHPEKSGIDGINFLKNIFKFYNDK